MSVANFSAISSNSRQALRASWMSPVASMISMWAGSSFARSQPVGGRVQDAADRRASGVGASLRHPQQSESRLRVRIPIGPRFDTPPRPPQTPRAAGASRLADRTPRQGDAGRLPGRTLRRRGMPLPWHPARRRCSSMISARCTRQAPVKATISGCCSHHRDSAEVHSRARLNAHTCWQASITLQ